MKIFLDTADLSSIKLFLETGLIDGITTNPTHLAAAGGKVTANVKAICKEMGDLPVSVEVTDIEPNDVYTQAREIAAIAKNVVVKIPCHQEYYPVIRQLALEGVALNVTLVFTMLQGLMMAKLGVQYVSPFVGRLDDIDVEGIEVIAQMRTAFNNYGFENTEILAASLRHVRHVHQSAMYGANIATVPPALFEKMMQHPLTDQGIQKFHADWQKLGIKQFP